MWLVLIAVAIALPEVVVVAGGNRRCTRASSSSHVIGNSSGNNRLRGLLSVEREPTRLRASLALCAETARMIAHATFHEM